MKKLWVIMSLLILAMSIQAYELEEQPLKVNYYQHQASTLNNVVQIKIKNDLLDAKTAKSADPKDMVFSKTYALPYQSAELSIDNLQIEDYNQNGQLIQTRYTHISDIAKCTNQFTFKEMRGFTVHFNPVIENENGFSIVKYAEFSLVGSGRLEVPAEISEGFVSLYENLAVNYYDSYLHNSPLKKPSILIISHNALTNDINSYVRWRKANGFDVNVITKETIGTNPTNTQIKQAIVNFYNQAVNKPDYLLLLGDSNISSYYKLPTFYINAPGNPEVCATDLDYALITGEDYFPEMLIGRMCIDSNSELQTVLSKTIRYERAPTTNTNNWQNKALVVAGNYAAGTLIPTTPVDMSRWIYDKFISSGYPQVDTVFYQNTSGSSTPPEYLTEQIINAINSGVQYVSYRGWGSGNGWQFPIFYRAHVNATNNSGRTPVVYSIVCDNGDYDNEAYDPCFGEVWMTKGSPTEPDGAVAFVGPSFLNTSTPLNNCISSGMFRSVLDEQARIFGTTVMRGKIELYNNFPNDQGNGGNVPFYFRIYNMLSDPSLSMWKLNPLTISHNLPDQIYQSTNYLEVQVPSINHGYVTGTKNNTDYTYARIIDGYAMLPVDNNLTGNLTVTITAKNYLPIVKTITVNASNHVGIVSYNIPNGGLHSGQTSQLFLTVKNFGTEAVSNATGILSSDSDFISFSNSSLNIGNLNAGESKEISTSVTVAAACPNLTQVPFALNITPGNSTSKFMSIVGGMAFEIRDALSLDNNGIVIPGQTSTIQFTAENIGNVNAENLSVSIIPMTDAVSCNSNPVNIPNITIGNTQNITFELSVQSNCFVGRNAQFCAEFTTTDGKTTRAYFNLTIGAVDNSSPTGPDNYGYFAYDSNDANYPQKPTFSWVDLDQVSPTTLLMTDDSSTTINLPFTFKYYGINYNRLTICSNGWVAFKETWQNDFSNWNIPSALGPYAMLAPYWDDLKGLMTAPNTWDPMKVRYFHDASNNRFIIDWKDTYSAFNNTSLEKFQIILYPHENQDGDIVFQYHTIDNLASNNNFATVGIENHLQNDGIPYSFANIYPASASQLTNGMAIKFTTTAPDNYVSNDNHTVNPEIYQLHQNYPNPFNPSTTIAFNLPEAGFVNLEIFNVKGQKVKTLTNQHFTKGQHQITWNGTDDNQHQVSSGIYFYKLTHNQKQLMKKMLMMK